MTTSILELERTELQIPCGSMHLVADVTVPHAATGVVLFAHGSGSSRHSARNHFVADKLNSGGLATVMADLLTTDEEAIDQRTSEFRFDIALLTKRVISIIEWAVTHGPLRGLPVGLFGASTGAAAALDAAAARPGVVKAVVCRGGRTDLATDVARVKSPTLLIVGGDDALVLDLNQQTLKALKSPSQLDVVAGASHLFEEAGALDEVASVARKWFAEYLKK